MTIFQGILFLEIPSSDAFIFIFSLLATKVQLQDGGFSHTPSLLLAVDFYPLPGNLKPGRREEDLHSGSKICLLPHGTLWVLFFHSPVLECLLCVSFLLLEQECTTLRRNSHSLFMSSPVPSGI